MTDLKQLAENLRRYNAWRRGAEGVEMPSPKDLGKWIEEAAVALDCLTEPEPIKCETCEGAGKIDERLGGYHTSNANAQCPDCDGAGYLESIHDFRPGQWWVKELDGIQASQEATPDQKRAVAVVHNLLRHILKLERTERTAGAEGAQAEEALPGNVLARRVEKLEADRDALAAELKSLREQMPVGIVDEGDDGVFADLETTSGVIVKLGDKLYARPVPARELTDADIGRCIASADRSFEQEPISGSPVLGVWSRHLARAIERHMRGEGE